MRNSHAVDNTKLIRITLTALLLAGLASRPAAAAEKLRDLEVDCWHKSIESGAFHCSYVVIMGKTASDGRMLMPELLAPDDGGPKTREQALRACHAMGFDGASSFALEPAMKETAMVTIGKSLREGEVTLARGKFIQHVSCE